MNQTQLQIHTHALFTAKAFRKAESDLLEALASVEKHRVFLAVGCRSLSEYCRRILELSEDVAMNFIRVMRKSQEVPALKEAIRRGTLTVSKARKIVPILKPENSEFWIRQAQCSSANELERKVAAQSPEPIRKETVRTVSEEMVSITIRIKRSDYNEIKRAQDVRSQKLKRTASVEETILEAIADYLDQNDPTHKGVRSKKKPSGPGLKIRPASASKAQSLTTVK